MNAIARCLVVVVCLALVSGTPSAAQQGPPKPDENRPGQTVTAPASSFVFERQHMRVRVDADGSSTRTMTMHLKVNDALGVRQAGQIPLNYIPSLEKLRIVTLEVRKPDGRVVAVDGNAVADHAIQPFASSTMLVDLRQKLITVPALTPGDTVALVAEWKVERPVVANHTWYEHSFIKHAIAADERLELDLPASLTATVRTTSGAPPEAAEGKGIVEGGRRIYRWQTSNLKMPTEDDAPEETPPPDVRFTTFRDWDTVARWFRPLMHPASDATVRAKALELTKGLTDREAKTRAIYDYVATQIRYVSLSFGLGRYAPHSPADVLKNQYGDCKDKHALLAAMLDTIGVRAVGVLINSERDVSSDLPSPSEFDHVVTVIPSGDDPNRWTWLDTTTEVAPYGMLLESLRGNTALFLGADAIAPRVVTAPTEGPFPFFTHLDLDGAVNPLGVLVSRVTLRLRGDTEIVVRNAVRELPKEQYAEFAKGFATSAGFSGEVSEFKASDPLATAQPFELAFTVRKKGFLPWAAATATVEVSAGSMEVAPLEDVSKDRKLGAGHHTRRRVTIALPPGYTATAPVGVSVDKHGLQYRSAYRVDGNRLVVERDLTLSARELAVANAADYGAVARTITSDHKQTFGIARHGSGMPAIPADMTASELYPAGYSAFDAKQYDTAVQLWKKATELDPKMSSAWSGLGFAYQRLKRYDEAIAAMEKQIELDPSNKRIHTDLGYVAKMAGRLDVAARAYAKHVEMNPLDGPAYKLLGEIHLDRDDFASAIPVLEKAAALEKADDWILVLLGAAHLRQGDLRRANEAFDRAIAMKGSPAAWTRMAWELASKGAEPAKASALLDRASKQIMESTASLAAGDVTDAHIDAMRRLGWIWDARGMLAMKKKDIAAAIRHFEAAWDFLNEVEVVEHLGEAYEAAPNRSSDALNAYLVARSYPGQEVTRLDERIRRLAPNLDIEAVMKAAGRQFIEQRAVVVQGDWGKQTKAELTAILDASGKVIDVHWTSGDEQVRGLPAKLMGLKFPIEAPGPEPVRLALKLRALCTPPLGCGVLMLPPVEAR